MPDRLICLDTTTIIQYLLPEELHEAAVRLVLGALQAEAWLVAPAWCWAEVGSVLRKKLRAGLVQPDNARILWSGFLTLPIAWTDSPVLRGRTWEIAEQYSLPTLYDAAFLACTELALAPAAAQREFWTADRALLRSLGLNRPAYVRQLGL